MDFESYKVLVNGSGSEYIFDIHGLEIPYGSLLKHLYRGLTIHKFRNIYHLGVL